MDLTSTRKTRDIYIIDPLGAGVICGTCWRRSKVILALESGRVPDTKRSLFPKRLLLFWPVSQIQV